MKNVNFVCVREKIEIPRDKPYIILKGVGKRKTTVEWNDHGPISESATFSSMADNVVVKSISFRVRNNPPITKCFHLECKKNFPFIYAFSYDDS